MKRTFLFFLPLIVLLTLSGCNTDSGDTEGAASENSASVTASVTASDEAAKEADTAVKEDFDYSINGGSVHIKKYLGNETVVVVPETIEGCAVKSVDAHFLEGSCVEEITYPSGMTEFKVLSRCENLKTLHLPASIEKMQDTLRFCENLTEIDIVEGGAYKTAEGVLYTSDMKTLVSYPCGRTGSFTVPEGVESIGKKAFFNSKLSEVVLPYGVESIGEYAFYNSKLSEIVLPDSLKTVEDYAFATSEALKETVVPASVKSIGVGAFWRSGLKKVTLSEGNEEIMDQAFLGTQIEELYLPASVVMCGSDIADKNVYIFASYPYEGLEPLMSFENVEFRDETRLEEALRKAESIVDEVENGYYGGVIITDITGDNFPEIMRIRGIDWISIYFFSEKGEWQVLTGSAIDSGYCRGDLAFYLLYDKENDTYSYYSGVYDFTVWGSISSAYVPCQCKLSFTEEGMVQTDLFNDDIIDISDAEIIDTMDISGILNGIAAKYNIDFEDEYKKFTVIADGLAEEPDGKIYGKTLTLNGKTIEALPYFKCAYPEEFKLMVAGKDILRDEEVSGVYFKHGMLTLDNAVIDAGGEDYVIAASGDFISLDIKLIGENRIVSEKPCSLLNTERLMVAFLGEGSLEAPKIEARWLELYDGVKLRENKELVSDERGVNAYSLALYGNSCLECDLVGSVGIGLYDNAQLKLKSLICDIMTLNDNSTVEIINDIPDAVGFSGCAVQRAQSISVGDNARFYADNSLQKYDTLYFDMIRANVNVSGNGYFEIRGNADGAGIAAIDWIMASEEGKIVINGAKTCIEAPRIDMFGGSMELNACGGGKTIKIADKDEDFESGYFIYGEVLSESPEGWEIVTENEVGVMCCDGKAVTSYSVSVKQREYDEANGFSD